MKALTSSRASVAWCLVLAACSSAPVDVDGAAGQAPAGPAPASDALPDTDDMGRGPFEEVGHDISLDGVMLARSVIDENPIRIPGKVSWTDHEDGAASYGIDLAMKLPLYQGTRARAGEGLPWDTQISALIEYHRNNRIEEEQNVLRAGLTFDGSIGSSESGEGLLFALPLTFRRDIVTSDEWFDAAFRLLPAYDVIGTKDDFVATRTLGIPWRARWQPTVGLEYAHTVHPDAGGPDGWVLRPVLGVAVGFYPWCREAFRRDEHDSIRINEFGGSTTTVARPIHVVGSVEYRDDVHETGIVNDSKDRHRVYRLSITYFLDRDEHFGFGIDYVNGEDPTEGLAFQRYWEVSLKLLF